MRDYVLVLTKDQLIERLEKAIPDDGVVILPIGAVTEVRAWDDNPKSRAKIKVPHLKTSILFSETLAQKPQDVGWMDKLRFELVHWINRDDAREVLDMAKIGAINERFN